LKRGIIFDIQRFAIYDGPGIRTLVFLKGCPLRCWWCQNPEGLSRKPQLAYYEQLCQHCHLCAEICPTGAIKITTEDIHIIDRRKCNLCGKCYSVCPTGALKLIGREITVDELIKEIKRDAMFYDSSGGGVTFSGGEPLYQPDFLLQCLKECQEYGIHTALETSGYADKTTFRKISNFVDLFLFDIKIINEEKHKYYTGVSNKPILENLKFLVKSGRGEDVIIRFPIIPTITDTEENLRDIISLLSSLKTLERVHLLPFHDVSEKYRYLDLPYRMPVRKAPTIERINEIKERFENLGLSVSLWGIG